MSARAGDPRKQPPHVIPLFAQVSGRPHGLELDRGRRKIDIVRDVGVILPKRRLNQDDSSEQQRRQFAHFPVLLRSSTQSAWTGDKAWLGGNRVTARRCTYPGLEQLNLICDGSKS